MNSSSLVSVNPTVNRVAFVRDNVLVLHDLESEVAIAAVSLSSAIRRVAIWDNSAIAIDVQGEITEIDPARGVVLRCHKALFRQLEIFAAATNAPVLASAGSEGVEISVNFATPRFISHPGITALGFDSDGSNLGCGAVDGTFSLFDQRGATLWGVKFPSSINAVASCGKNGWLIAHGTSIDLVKPTHSGESCLRIELPSPASFLTVGPDDKTLAYTLDCQTVGLFDLDEKVFARALFTDKLVGEVALTVDCLIASLDNGEGNKLFLRRGAVNRFDPPDNWEKTGWTINWFHFELSKLRSKEQELGKTIYLSGYLASPW